MENIREGSRAGSVITEYYLYILFVFLILRSINYYSLIPSVFDSIVFALLAVAGGAMIAWNCLDFLRHKSFVSYDWWLIGFLIVMFISSLLNRHYGVSGNFKTIVWSAIYFFLIYALAANGRLSKYFYQTVIRIFGWAYFFVSLVSFGMYLIQYSYLRPGTIETRIRIGFLEGRLFGAFGDPNFGGMFALILVIVCIYGIVVKSHVFPRWFLFTNLFLQTFVLVLTVSRSAILIGEALAAVVFVALVARYLAARGTNLLVNIVASVITLAVSVVALTFFVASLKWLLEKLPPLFEFLQIHRPHGREVVSLKRADVADNSDISNMRFSIWSSAIEIFKTKWIFGVSPRNMVAYAKDMLPKSLIAQQGFKTHNAWIDVLASTGLVGFVTMIGFSIKSAFMALRSLQFGKKMLSADSNVQFLIVASLIGFTFFVNVIFFTNDVCSFIFWMVLGNMYFQFRQRQSALS